MKLKFTINPIVVLFFLVFFSSQKSFAQCFQIESILVAACRPGGPETEGFNEMVRFRIGATAVNTNNLNVNWVTNNSWQGLVQNATTSAKVATLNADIDAAGGCGNLLQPTNGVLPANAPVILVTSHTMDTDSNSFGALGEDTYIIFQNNSNNGGGHFTNYGTSNIMKTFSMNFGSGCSDTVTYNRSLLVNQSGANVDAPGAIVNFTPSGTPTYVNYGCSAPVQPFTVDAGPATMNVCAGQTISLNGTAQGQTTVTWSAPQGSFSAPGNLSTNYTIPSDATGTIVLSLIGTNACGFITDTVTLNVQNSIVPSFNIPTVLCNGAAAPILPNTSINNVSGTWSPSEVSNTVNGTYVFTPNAGQCATPFTLNVTVGSAITPVFNIANTLCSGTVAPVLPTTSSNGITGTWSPSAINNSANGTYVFTPTASSCAVPFTLNVTVSSAVTPIFNIATTLCSGTVAPVLPTTSSNGITGTWLPSVIDNTVGGSYVFTPNATECATSFTLVVTITNSITPVFTIVDTFCNGTTAPLLPTTSDNGITGTWSPSVISNTANGTYVFTPTAGQCGEPFTLSVTVTPNETPDFDTALTICSGQTPPVLDATSPNGITGVWSPAVIDSAANGTYIFTPNAGQCATSLTLSVTLSVFEVSFDQRCINGEFIVTAQAVNNSFDPNNVTFLWKDSKGVVVGTNDEYLNITHLMNSSTLTFPAIFTVTVSDLSGCTTTENVTVNGAFCNIPRGISPNGDNSNDSFDLTGLGVDDIKIYNRYGTEVFHQKNYTNQWRGQTDKGDELPTATYFYVIQKNTGESVTGWVYINR